MGLSAITGNLATDFNHTEFYDNNDCLIIQRTYIIFMVILLLVGGTGNLLSIFVAVSMRKLNNSTLICLGYLATADSIVLITLATYFLIFALTNGKINAIAISHCYIMFPLLLSILISHLTLASISFLRFIHTWFPLKVKSWCTTSKIKGMLIAIFIVAFCLNLVHLFAYEVQKTDGVDSCVVRKQFQIFYFKFWVYMVFMATLLLPWVCIVLFSSLTVMKITHRAWLSKTRALGQTATEKAALKTTGMLLVVTMWFVLSLGIVLAYVYLSDAPQDNNTFDKYMLCDTRAAIGWVIFTSNYAVNFFLYILVSKEYRQFLYKALRQIC